MVEGLQAVGATVTCRLEDGKKGKGKGSKGENTQPKKGKGKGKGGGLQRFQGLVKVFNETRGYFFVDCPEIYGDYKCDVVLQQHDCPKATVGCTIEFCAVEAEGFKNPVAQKVRVIG
eukprot:GEMP01081986.1.p2 GENE.GEMP01081986.1~~GEMP01081986.1.p2  ORF type:complete len:117 (+),score=36.06 GEMP01081986.1:111-461(+)